MLSTHQSIALASRKHCSCHVGTRRAALLDFAFLPRTRRAAFLDYAFPSREPAVPCNWALLSPTTNSLHRVTGFFFPPPKTLRVALLFYTFPHQQRGTPRPYIIAKRNSCFRSFCSHLLKKTEKNLHIRYKCSNFAPFSGMRGSHRAPHSFVNGV